MSVGRVGGTRLVISMCGLLWRWSAYGCRRKVWLSMRLRGLERVVRRSRRCSSRSHDRRVRVGVLRLAVRWRRSLLLLLLLLSDLSSLCRVRGRKSWRVRLFVRTFATSFLTRVRCSSRLRRCDMTMRRSLLHVAWGHGVDWWTLRRVALWRVGVLRWRIRIAVLLRWKRLTIGSVKLLWLCALLSPDGMRRDECLRLC
jgi:hypothetical protein